jgi:hypothetical protein
MISKDYKRIDGLARTFARSGYDEKRVREFLRDDRLTAEIVALFLLLTNARIER